MIKRATYFIAAILFFAGLFWLLSQPPKTQTESIQAETNSNIDYSFYKGTDLVLFWSSGCSHCQNVEEWLQENNSNENLKIMSKQIDNSDENHQEMIDLVKENCPELLESGSVGIPVAFDPVNKKCIQGDTPIIHFLSAKLAP